ncbi:MAG: 50S ribosomal protein L10, partial [Synechococcaceae cyanobacterium SM2_3_1]|nr:50S ribosomal protein L10 [Synechococcaceae cyanobacterium SM2_3_1]
MGKQPITKKTEIVEEVGSLLDSAQMVLSIDYKGLTVSEMTTFRAELRAADATCMVVKNTLMRRAISDRPTWAGLGEFLSGPNVFVLIRGDIGKTVKIFQDFQKKTKKTEFRGAAIDGMALNRRAGPGCCRSAPKEVLLAQASRRDSAIATRLAVSLQRSS